MGQPAESLAPGILLAMPQLVEPNFRRTVVLVTGHGEDGTMGFVVNRSIPATVEEVLEGLDIPWKGPPGLPVWQGGPVMPQTGWVLFEAPPESPFDDAGEVLPGLFLTASLDALRRLAQDPPARFRLLLGYSGWSSQQVEREMAEGSWFYVPATMGLVFATPPEEMWEGAFRGFGVDPASIVPGEGIQ